MHATSHRSITRTFAAFTVVVLAACGGDDGYGSDPEPAPTPVQAATVDAQPSIQFSPNRVVLVRGGKVTFRFGSVPHNVFFDGAPEGAPDDITGTHADESVELTFGTSGTFPYNCHLHPGMSGTVVVQ